MTSPASSVSSIDRMKQIREINKIADKKQEAIIQQMPIKDRVSLQARILWDAYNPFKGTK